MAKIATQPKGEASAPRGGMSGLKQIAFAAGLIAALNKIGLQNALASTLVTLAAPITATAFVYEVSALRSTQLAHEASDRARFYAERMDPSSSAPSDASNADLGTMTIAPDRPDVAGKLDAILASRAAILDTFGDDASAVAPVYARMIRQMLKDDAGIFASLQSKTTRDAGRDDGLLERKEAGLRLLHKKLARLVEQ